MLDKDIILLMIQYTDKQIDEKFNECEIDLPTESLEYNYEVDLVKSKIERLNRLQESIVEAKEVLNYRLTENKLTNESIINCLVECERIDGSVYCNYHSFDFDEKRYNRIMRKLKLKRVRGI